MWLNLFCWDSHRIHTCRKCSSLFFCSFSCFTVLANCSSSSPSPSAPHFQLLYFFLTHLSLIDGIFTSVTTPKLVTDLLHQRRTISESGYLIQNFLEHIMWGSEIILLISMSYDYLLWQPASLCTTRPSWDRAPASFLVMVAWIKEHPACHCADSFNLTSVLLDITDHPCVTSSLTVGTLLQWHLQAASSWQLTLQKCA